MNLIIPIQQIQYKTATSFKGKDQNGTWIPVPKPPIGHLKEIPRDPIRENFVPYDYTWKPIQLKNGSTLLNIDDYYKYVKNLSDYKFTDVFIENNEKCSKEFIEKIFNELRNKFSPFELFIIQHLKYKVSNVNEIEENISGRFDYDKKRIFIAEYTNNIKNNIPEYILNHEMGHFFDEFTNYYSQGKDFNNILDFDLKRITDNDIELLEEFLELKKGVEKINSKWGKSELFAHLYQSVKMKDNKELSEILDYFPTLSSHMELLISKYNQVRWDTHPTRHKLIQNPNPAKFLYLQKFPS
jgi:hypothetical protein